jgi:FtsZ-interacting cell division protein ZipA
LHLLPLIAETLLTTATLWYCNRSRKKHFDDKSAASSNPKKTDTTLMKQQLTTAQCEAAGRKKNTPKECSWKQRARNPTPSCRRQGSTDMKNERSCFNVEEKKKEQQKQLQKKNPLHYSAF